MLFIPARNKLEAVARISQLTNSGPETLGPGSKERRSVLDNLGLGIGLEPSNYDSKQTMAAAIASRLSVKWTAECESTGQTITLKGLNLLLEAGLKHFEKSFSESVASINPSKEIGSIKTVLDRVTPRYMDGKESVLEMKDADADNWRQTEWQGWYFEFKAIPALINEIGGGPTVIGNTKFDYALSRPWDLKTHSNHGINGPSKPNKKCILNDQSSMLEAIKSNGLGLIILSGIPKYDDKDFSSWHKALRSKTGPVRKQLKNGFTSEKIEFFFLENPDELEKAVSKGILTEFNQGKQQSGESRAPKFALEISKAREDAMKKEELNL